MGHTEERREIINRIKLFFQDYVAQAPDPNSEQGRSMVARYVDFLHGFGIDRARRALDHIQFTYRDPYFPRLPVLVGAVHAAIASEVPDKEEAWVEVLAAFSAVGIRGTPTFTHPMVGEAVNRIGGWFYLCGSDKPQIDRANFFKIYDGLLEKWVLGEMRNAQH